MYVSSQYVAQPGHVRLCNEEDHRSTQLPFSGEYGPYGVLILLHALTADLRAAPQASIHLASSFIDRNSSTFRIVLPFHFPLLLLA